MFQMVSAVEEVPPSCQDSSSRVAATLGRSGMLLSARSPGCSPRAPMPRPTRSKSTTPTLTARGSSASSYTTTVPRSAGKHPISRVALYRTIRSTVFPNGPLQLKRHSRWNAAASSSFIHARQYVDTAMVGLALWLLLGPPTSPSAILVTCGGSLRSRGSRICRRWQGEPVGLPNNTSANRESLGPTAVK